MAVFASLPIIQAFRRKVFANSFANSGCCSIQSSLFELLYSRATYVPPKKRNIVNNRLHMKYDYRLTNTGEHCVGSLSQQVICQFIATVQLKSTRRQRLIY